MPSTRGSVSDIHRGFRAIPEVQRDVKGIYDMLSDVRDIMAKGQEGSDGMNVVVSEICTLSTVKCPLTVAQTQTRSAI